MEKPEPNPQVEALLLKGVEAARSGDKATARALLEQVVEKDQYCEKGWFWLAAVVETVEEKRVCLGNVVVINPNNQRAQRLLDQLESKPAAMSKGLGASKNVSSRSVYLAIGLGAAAVVALLVLIIMMSGGKDKDSGSTTGGSPGQGQSVAVQGTSTAQVTGPLTPQATPTPLATSTPLPPTWTPAPSPTPVQIALATPLAPPPSGTLGKIILRSGQVIGDDANQPIVVINADGSGSQVVTPDNERGHAPVFSPDGSQYAFIKFAPGTREVILQTNTMQATAPKWSSTRWGGTPFLTQQDTPTWSPNSAWIAFTAMGPGATAPDLYRVAMNGPDGNPDSLEQLTSDEAAESWPAFSPDSRFIVYSATFTLSSGETLTELRIYNLEEGGYTDLTTNRNDLIESAPDWSPDGKRIVFQAQAAGASQPDIYWMPADGSAPPEKLIESEAADSTPRFSPDGRSIVFSSDRTGNWDVFIYEIATKNVYQVTSGPQTDVANDWGI